MSETKVQEMPVELDMNDRDPKELNTHVRVCISFFLYTVISKTLSRNIGINKQAYKLKLFVPKRILPPGFYQRRWFYYYTFNIREDVRIKASSLLI